MRMIYNKFQRQLNIPECMSSNSMAQPDLNLNPKTLVLPQKGARKRLSDNAVCQFCGVKKEKKQYKSKFYGRLSFM